MPAELTPNAVLVRRALALVAVALAALLALALLSKVFGREFVLAIDAANAAARAERYDRTGEPKAAAAEYYRILEVRPADTRLRAALVELLLRTGDTDEALRQAQRLVDTPSSTDRARDLAFYGHALSAARDLEAAAAAYDEALALRAGYPDALYGLALNAAMTGDTAAAEEQFARLRTAGPGEASDLYTRSIRDGEALQRRYQDSAGGEWRLTRAETIALIEWHLKHGRFEGARAVYRASPRWPAVTSADRALEAVARIEEDGNS